jgi:hypothetical protein
MLKRVQINGFIEIPEGSELPELGEWVTIGEFKAEVTADGREKQKRRGDVTELVYTTRIHVPEDAHILKVEAAPEPLFDAAESGGGGSAPSDEPAGPDA